MVTFLNEATGRERIIVVGQSSIGRWKKMRGDAAVEFLRKDKKTGELIERLGYEESE